MPSDSSSRVVAAVSSIVCWVAEFEPRAGLLISVTDIPASSLPNRRLFQHEYRRFERVWERHALDSRISRTYVPRSRWHSPNESANSVSRDLVFQSLSRAPRTRKEMAKTKFRPLHDRVVVKRVDAEEKSKGGIIIPDTAKEKPQEGEVVAVGPGGRDEAGKLIPIDLKPGNRVLFGKWSGTEVKIDGDDLLIMKESDVMGVLDVPAAKKKAA